MAFNFEKLTHKSQEAVQKAIELATQLGHQQIETEHITYPLLKIEDSLIVSFLVRLNISVPEVLKKLEDALEKRPVVQGGQPFFIRRFK